MPRYIDAEKILFTKYINGSVNVEKEVIDALPTADVQEVVRCKDCKFRFTTTCFAKHETADGDYCSNGTRMDGE